MPQPVPGPLPRVRLSWLLMGKPLPDLEAEAAACEGAGLDGIWWPDYQGPTDPDAPYPELAVTLTLLARTTRRAFVGSLITDVVRRHPAVVAHTFATLTHLAPARVILGLGGGGGTSHFPFGITLSASAARLAEGIEVIRRLWRATGAQPAFFRGRFFRLEDAALPIRPRTPIPIYVAAQGPRMLRTAADRGDGWMPECHTPQTYRQVRELLAEWRMRPGASPVFDWGVALLFYPFEPDAAERPRLLRAAKSMLAFNVHIVRRLLPHAVSAGIQSIDLAAQPALWSRLREAIPDDVAVQTALIGPPGACGQRIREYVDAGCRHIVLEPYWRMTREQTAEAIRVAGALGAQWRLSGVVG